MLGEVRGQGCASVRSKKDNKLALPLSLKASFSMNTISKDRAIVLHQTLLLKQINHLCLSSPEARILSHLLILLDK